MSLINFLQNATEEQLQRLDQCESVEAVVALLYSFGANITAEEIQKLKETSKAEKFGELDEEDLDHVAGGQGVPISFDSTSTASNIIIRWSKNTGFT